MTQTMHSAMNHAMMPRARDGFQEQLQLLTAISHELDEYFAMRLMDEQM